MKNGQFKMIFSNMYCFFIMLLRNNICFIKSDHRGFNKQIAHFALIHNGQSKMWLVKFNFD